MQILSKYPKTTELINKWFVKQLIDSLKDDTIPEEFRKQYENNTIIDNKELERIIKSSPRALFDFFDTKKVYISIIRDYEHNTFRYTFDGKVESNDYSLRKEAEEAAIERAFKMLEEI